MKKNTALHTINDLPEEFELDQLLEKLVFMEKVEKGLEQAKSGQTIGHEKVVDKLRKKWSK